MSSQGRGQEGAVLRLVRLPSSAGAPGRDPERARRDPGPPQGSADRAEDPRAGLHHGVRSGGSCVSACLCVCVRVSN